MGTEERMRRGKNDYVNIIPNDISKAMQVSDIPMIFDYLEKTFHVSKNWRVFYQNELQNQVRNMGEKEFFCLFLQEHIEPPINRLRMRNDSLFAMLRYLLKDRIEEQEKQEARYHGYYDKDGKFQKGR